MVIFTTLIFVVLGLTLIMLLTFATNKLTSQQAGLFLITYTKDICPSNCDLENIESNKNTNDVVEISMETIYNNALANLNEKLKKSHCLGSSWLYCIIHICIALVRK